MLDKILKKYNVDYESAEYDSDDFEVVITYDRNSYIVIDKDEIISFNLFFFKPNELRAFVEIWEFYYG